MMIELLTNMIAWTALGGSLLIIVLLVIKASVSLAARASVPKTSPAVVSKERVCRYCGVILGEEHKCKNCGAVERNEQQ
jgi:nitrous oxide reductase accessory protein NosL